MSMSLANLVRERLWLADRQCAPRTAYVFGAGGYLVVCTFYDELIAITSSEQAELIIVRMRQEESRA
jgi:hypothetical protein